MAAIFNLRASSQVLFLQGLKSVCSRNITLSHKVLATPVVAAKMPYEENIVSGTKYSWCSCGKSNKQPFCDGSHKKTGMRPFRMVADETCTRYFCGCKQTKNPPYCDGSHMDDAVQNCKIGECLS